MQPVDVGSIQEYVSLNEFESNHVSFISKAGFFLQIMVNKKESTLLCLQHGPLDGEMQTSLTVLPFPWGVWTLRNNVLALLILTSEPLLTCEMRKCGMIQALDEEKFQ